MKSISSVRQCGNDRDIENHGANSDGEMRLNEPISKDLRFYVINVISDQV